MEIQDLERLLQNRDVLSNLFIFIVMVIALQVFDTKIIIGISVVSFLMLNYNNLKGVGNTTLKTKESIKKGEIANDMYYNNKIHDLLIEIKHYKKYNKVSYKEGVKYMRKFIKTLHILEKDTINNYNQYFDNAFIYLKTAINHFQSITVSLPERTLTDGIKHGDYEATKKANKLGKLCKELYKECYYVLLNLSIKLNKKWEKHPNIYNREITLNTQHVEEHNKDNDDKWSLY